MFRFGERERDAHCKGKGTCEGAYESGLAAGCSGTHSTAQRSSPNVTSSYSLDRLTWLLIHQRVRIFGGSPFKRLLDGFAQSVGVLE
jgi:hypothetical protein